MECKPIEKERRRDARYSFSGMLFFQIAIPADDQSPHGLRSIPRKEKTSAHIQNVGERGCCVNVDWFLRKFQIIKVEFPLPQSGVSIPTLAEIRWIRKASGIKEYTVGLRYLL